MKRFLTTFFLTAAIGVTSIAALNVLVDPFAFFDVVRIRGVNWYQSNGSQSYIHNVKPFQIALRNPETVFIGTSRVYQGFDPDDTGACRYTNAYNYGIDAIETVDQHAFLRHAVAVAPVRRALVEADFYGAIVAKERPSKVPRHLYDPRWPFESLTNILFSYTAVKYSLHTVVSNLTGEARARMKPNGWREFEADPHRDLDSVRQRYTFLLGRQRNWSIDPVIRDLDETLTRMRAENIDVTVFIPPSHVFTWKLFEHRGEWGTFEAWKKAVTEVATKHRVPIWDFADYHPITTAKPIIGQSEYFNDHLHFRSNVGRMMMERMCGAEKTTDAVADGFGTRIDSIDIERHIEAIRARGDDYWLRHPEAAAFYTDIRDRWQARKVAN